MRRKNERKVNRAVQFLPFSGLKGYELLLREAERIKEPQRELSEDRAAFLDTVICRINKGDAVEIAYYNVDSYKIISGEIGEIDMISKVIKIGNLTIAFKNIWEIQPYITGKVPDILS